MRRLYATRVDTRMPYSFVELAFKMKRIFDKPVNCVKDTDNYSLIFLVSSTATEYCLFERFYDYLSEWVDFDYFNFNEIEE